MKRGLLLIDRGSKEAEVKDELSAICKRVQEKGKYEFANYCFLEVVPPFIEEGIQKCVQSNIDQLTIVPYFLYPGKKVKAAVREAVRFQAGTNIKFVFTKPMSMHEAMVDIVRSKVSSALAKNGIKMPEKDVDVLIIGHGSKDPNARMSIQYVTDKLLPTYRNVSYCFLEIEEPTIEQGIQRCQADKPEVLVIVFYFLHEGAHVKRDIYGDLNPALEKFKIKRHIITDHIGTDEKMIDFIIARTREVEDAD
jgi:sirohydrochlorin cobaltochelatase